MLESKYLECVKIGDQYWTTQNLDINHFRNGDLIPESKTYQEWIDYDLAGEPTFCYYDFDPNNGKKFGKLYNFHAIHDPRGLSPENFSIPTLDDFSQLIDFLEKENDEVGFKDWIKNYIGTLKRDFIPAGIKLKSDQNWVQWFDINDENWYDGNGNNKSGFSALPGGYLSDKFKHIGEICSFWCNTDIHEDKTTFEICGAYGGFTNIEVYEKNCGSYVRCLRK